MLSTSTLQTVNQYISLKQEFFKGNRTIPDIMLNNDQTAIIRQYSDEKKDILARWKFDGECNQILLPRIKMMLSVLEKDNKKVEIQSETIGNNVLLQEELV